MELNLRIKFERMPSTSGLVLLCAGVFVIIVASGITVAGCGDYSSTNRVAKLAYFEMICPAGRLEQWPGTPIWYGFFYKIWGLWLLGLGCIIAGAVKMFRASLRNTTLETVLSAKKSKTSKSANASNIQAASGFGKRRENLVVAASRDLERVQSEQHRLAIQLRANALEEAGKVSDANQLAAMQPAQREEIVVARAKQLAETNNHRSLDLRIRELLKNADVAAALGIVKNSVDNTSGDIFASSGNADIDWIGICAETIEADAELKSRQGGGCKQVRLEIGNLPETCLNIRRRYFGATPIGVDVSQNSHPGKAAYANKLGSNILSVNGLTDVAELQRHGMDTKWAGYLRVLRIFEAVQKHAETEGLPFPVRLYACVESGLGGEEGMRQLSPRLDVTIPCKICPASADVLYRLEQRYQVHVARWHDETSTLLGNIETQFYETGYVASRMIPDEMADVKDYFRGLEDGLAVYNPEHRVSELQLDELLRQIEKFRNDNVPVPTNTLPYR